MEGEEEEEEEAEEEDTHVCLRCRATIIGLSNYISHRRAGCGPKRRLKVTNESRAGTSKSVESLKGSLILENSIRPREEDKGYASTSKNLSVSCAITQSQSVLDSSHVSEPDGNLQTPSEGIQQCYATSSEHHEHDPLHKSQETQVLHNYPMLDGYASPEQQVHKESSHSPLKGKSQGGHALLQRQNPTQAPFTGYGDPLLPHSQDGVSLFRAFDSFSEHHKIQHEGETEHPMTLFKVSTGPYELESQSFESRYTDFYTIQSTPQEPILNNDAAVEHGKGKGEHVDSRMPETNHNQEDKKDQSCSDQRPTEEMEEGQRKSDSKFENHMSQEISDEKPEIQQHDFLSSLELQSSIKRQTKRRLDDDEEDDDEDEDDDGTRPPHHHTGGKWRPGSRPPPSVGGKWRPATPKTELEDENEDVEEEEVEETFAPMLPTYTKGKWLPGKKMTTVIKVGSSIEYHCSACNRTLKGKENYERHLNSELHFVNENKDPGKVISKPEDDTSKIETKRPTRSKKLKAQNFLKSTIARLKSRKVVSVEKEYEIESPKTRDSGANNKECSLLWDVREEAKHDPSDDDEEPVKKNSPTLPKLLCPICKLTFGVPYVSLHFASLAHIHNVLEYKQNTSPEVDSAYRKLILRHFGSIVKSSPFCCLDCKFYCNSHEDLLTHVKTHEEEIEYQEIKTVYSCSACNDEDCMSLYDVTQHLQTPYHKENSFDQILQAHQIVLTSKILIACPFGDGTFQYRRQYLSHRRLHHQDTNFRLADQRFLNCSQCNFKSLRERQMRIHIREVHKPSKKEVKYHCFVCGLEFPTHRQAELHRRSAEHRTTLGRQRGISVTRTCNLCYEETDDLPTLRQHMRKYHQKDCTPCHLCGIILPHRSDLAQHQRSCSKEPEALAGIHSCELCSFKNDLLAHVLLHLTLSHGQQEADGRYPCHLCKTKLKVSSVKGHMLMHTNEWPHACHLCSRKFPQALWLERHLAIVHTHSANEPRNTQSLCDLCGKTLNSRCHLHRHKQEVKCHAIISSHTQVASNVAEPAQCLVDINEEKSESTIYLSDTGPPHERGIEVTGTLDGDPVTSIDSAYTSILSVDGATTSTDFIAEGSNTTCFLAPHNNCRSKNQKSSSHKRHTQMCDVCGIQCDSLSTLKTHRQQHKKRDGDHYQCPHCAYKTTHLPHLRRHLRLHTGSTPFCCPYCSYVCNNQENLRKHMLMTKRHPGRFMYECRLCIPPESENSKPPTVSSSEQILDPSTSQPLVGSGNPTEDQNAANKLSKSEHDTVNTQTTSVFKSNYATELHSHLLQQHTNNFTTKEEVTRYIRSYYRAEKDNTVTTSPLPFSPKKRQKRSSSVPKVKIENPDDPAMIEASVTVAPISDDGEPEGDVISHINQTLMDDYDTTKTISSEDVLHHINTGEKEAHTFQESRVVTQPIQGAGIVVQAIQGSGILPHSIQRSGIVTQPIQEDEVVVPKDLAEVVAESSCDADFKIGRNPRSHIRVSSRPSILRMTQPQHSVPQQQPVRILIQHLPDTNPQEGEDGTRQVILILPEKVGGQPGDVAALLPSLGLASSPADCVSIVSVQPKDDHTRQQLRILSEEEQSLASVAPTQVQHMTKEGAVLMQGDQVMTLQTQMVTQADVAAVREPVLHHPGSVVLCSQEHEQEQLVNPLQVVAEVAEALTQNDLVSQPVLDHHQVTSNVLDQKSVVQGSPLLPEAMFDHAVGIEDASAAVQSADASSILQHEAAVEYVDDHVITSTGQVVSQTGEATGEIIYSLTL